MTNRLVDLSHPITDGMITYPGLPGPRIGVHLSREESRARYVESEFHIGHIAMVANTGTYVDTPFHRYADGADLAATDLARLVDLDGVVVPATGQRAVGVATLKPHEVAGRAVLIHTGWARHWGTDAYAPGEHPYVTAEAVDWLVEQGVALVGIDSVNIDDTATGARAAHTGLLAAGIPIVEHLTGLERLPASGFRFHAPALPVVGMGTSPLRAYAVIG